MSLEKTCSCIAQRDPLNFFAEISLIIHSLSVKSRVSRKFSVLVLTKNPAIIAWAFAVRFLSCTWQSVHLLYGDYGSENSMCQVIAGVLWPMNSALLNFIAAVFNIDYFMRCGCECLYWLLRIAFPVFLQSLLWVNSNPTFFILISFVSYESVHGFNLSSEPNPVHATSSWTKSLYCDMIKSIASPFALHDFWDFCPFIFILM